MAQTFKTYADFWPFYLSRRTKTGTRTFHYFGSGLALMLLAKAVQASEPLLVPLAVATAFIYGWIGLWFVERTQPTSFRYPIWSLISDYRMFYLYLTRRLDDEMRRVGPL